MANASDAGTDTGCPSSYRPTAQFKPFDWVQGDRLDASQRSHAAFLNDARDVVQGAQTLVQLLAASLSLLHARIEGQCEALAI